MGISDLMDALTRRTLLAGTLAGLVMDRRALAQGAPLICGIIDVPPWVIRDGRMPGAGVDIVNRLVADTGIPVDVKPAPHPRLLMELRSGQIDLVAFVPQAELEEAGRSLGELGFVEMGLTIRAGLTVTKLEDLAGRLVGIVRGSGLGPLIEMIPPGAERITVRDVAQGLDMIAGGRIDAFVGSHLASEWHMHQHDMDTNLFGPFFPMGNHPIRLYLSRARPYSKEIVDRLTMGVGSIREIFDELCRPYLRKA